MIDIEKSKEIIKSIKAHPLIQNVLIEQEYLSFSNTEIAIKIKTFKNNPISFLFPVDKLDILEDNISYNLEKKEIIINNTTSFPYPDKNDLQNYPLIPSFNENEFKFITAIKVDYLKDMLSFDFSSNQEERYILQFFLFEINEKFRIISSDGRRLAKTEIHHSSNVNTSFLVHREAIKVLKKILKILNNDNEYIGIYENERFILFKDNKNDIQFFCLKTSSEYPNWKAVFPSNPICSFAFPNLKKLSKFLLQIQKIQKKKKKKIIPVQVDIEYKDYKAKISYEDIENEMKIEQEFEIAIHSLSSSQNIHFHINPIFLNEAIKNMKNLLFFFFETNNALLLESSKIYPNTSINYSFLIMPHRCLCPKSE